MTQKLIVDCSTGSRQFVDLTPGEVAQLQLDAQAAAAAAAAATAAAQQHATDLAAVKTKAAVDPAFAALYRLLGGA